MRPAELRAWWRAAGEKLVAAARTVDAKARLPWYGPEMGAVSFITARLMETWSHGLDVVDVVGIERPDTDRLRHVVFLGVRTRPFSYVTRGLTPDTTPVLRRAHVAVGRDLDPRRARERQPHHGAARATSAAW